MPAEEVSFSTRYLRRIGCENLDLSTVSVDNLFKLQQKHLENVLFENLNFYFGEAPDNSKEFLTRKIIEQGKGGCCFETNTFFNYLLKDLGYDAYMVKGCVYNARNNKVRENDFCHVCNVVRIDGKKYIVNVAFTTRGAYSPLLMEEAITDQGRHGIFRVKKHSEKANAWIVQSKERARIPLYILDTDDEWMNELLFYDDEVSYEEVEKLMKWNVNENPTFYGTRILYVDRILPTGIRAMAANHVTLVKFGKSAKDDITETITVTSPEQRKEILKTHFDLDYNHNF